MKLPTQMRALDDPRNGPVVLRRDLVAQGLNDRAIARLVMSRQLVRIRRGAYAPADVWDALDDDGRFGLRGRAVLRQAKTPVILSHTSALPEYGAPTWGFDLNNVHVTRTDGLAGRKEAGVQQHCGLVLPGDFGVVNGVPVMTAARVALETTTLGNTEASLCVVNYLLHHGLVTEQELRAQYVEMNWWRDTLAAEVVLRLADGRIESVGETRTYWCCFQQGLPMPQPQYEVFDEYGHLVARVDFAWPEFGVFLEFDGRIKYEKLLRKGERPSDVVVREKKREEEVCRITRWRCLRVTWDDLSSSVRLATKIRSILFAAA